MWRGKKFIITVLLVAVVLVGSLTGVVLAQTGDEADSSQSKQTALMEKVCAIYEEDTGTAIDAEALQEAFDQARSEMQDEALDEYLQSLVDDGKITQEEADQYKAWLEAKPDMEPYRQQLREWQQARPEIPSELEDWWQSKPEDMPFGLGFGGRGGFRGFGESRVPAE